MNVNRCLTAVANNRRRFLQSTIALTAAAPFGLQGLLDANAMADDEAAEESETKKPRKNPTRESSKFKFSLAAYSYRGLLTGDPPKLTLFDFIDDCARIGLEGTELTSYYFPTDVDDDYLVSLRRHCFRQGLDVSGTAIGNDFGFPEGDDRNQQIANTKTWIERAALLGAPVIRIFAGHQKPGIDEAASHKLMVTAIEECCDYAGQHGVHLALENHGGPTATAAGLLNFVRDVKSPWFGVNLDTGNFHSDDIYGDLAKVAGHAINVQVKVVTKDSSGKVEPMKFDRLGDILMAANYRGYVVLEYEEKDDPRLECERYSDELRAAIG